MSLGFGHRVGCETEPFVVVVHFIWGAFLDRHVTFRFTVVAGPRPRSGSPRDVSLHGRRRSSPPFWIAT